MVFVEEKDGCNANHFSSDADYVFDNLFLDFAITSKEVVRLGLLRGLITNLVERTITMCKRYCVSKRIENSEPEHVVVPLDEHKLSVENR